MVPWSANLDLADFYSECGRRGLHNNSSKAALVDGVLKYPHSQLWILYYNGVAVGSAGAHNFELFGPNAYRICVRTCVLTDRTGLARVRSFRNGIERHQHITSQFFIPTCIEWAGKDKDLFISTHESSSASHRAVHRLFMPAFEKLGIVTNVGEQWYRGHKQTFWKINVGEFYAQLDMYPRWL